MWSELARMFREAVISVILTFRVILLTFQNYFLDFTIKYKHLEAFVLDGFFFVVLVKDSKMFIMYNRTVDCVYRVVCSFGFYFT